MDKIFEVLFCEPKWKWNDSECEDEMDVCRVDDISGCCK
jgi:hypothetical protein